MAFESLSERLGKAFKNITGKGKLSEKNMNDMLREVRMSLLEADVNYGVVKDFIARVKEPVSYTHLMIRAAGRTVIYSVTIKWKWNLTFHFSCYLQHCVLISCRICFQT